MKKYRINDIEYVKYVTFYISEKCPLPLPKLNRQQKLLSSPGLVSD